MWNRLVSDRSGRRTFSLAAAIASACKIVRDLQRPVGQLLRLRSTPDSADEYGPRIGQQNGPIC